MIAPLFFSDLSVDLLAWELSFTVISSHAADNASKEASA
jgi:hypothetical protein